MQTINKKTNNIASKKVNKKRAARLDNN